MLAVCAAKSNDGKTHITCALNFALCRMELQCRMLKVGPDYLDTACASQFAADACVNVISYDMCKLFVLLL